MSAFKDIVDQDILDVFVDFDEFGERHKIGTQDVLVVMDGDALRRRGDRVGAGLGVYPELGAFMLYVKTSDLDVKPQSNADILFDGKHCVVVECKEDAGMYTITLRQNR